MKKNKGYTLSEILVALGIIGIIAAIGAPMVNKARPDQTKIMFLKAYDSLTEAVSEIVNTPTIYAHTYSKTENNIDDAKIYDVQKYPLLDYNMPMSPDLHLEKYSGVAKFCSLIEDSFNATPANDCSKKYAATSKFENTYNFTTNPAGMQWRIGPSPAGLSGGPTGGTVNYANEVIVDINGDAEPNSTDGTVKRPPDRYKFYVFADGSIEPAGKFAQAFLANRLSLQKHKINLTNPQTNSEFTDKALNADNFGKYAISVGTSNSSDVKILRNESSN